MSNTQTTGVQVLIQTQQMSDPMTSYGKSLLFDFGSGNQILAYSVALSGFQVQYATQSTSTDEQVQQFAIGLIPSLVGSQVIVTSNILLADYDGDAASEKQDAGGIESYAIVTVIAIIGTAPTTNWTLTNVFGLPSETDSVNLPSFTGSLACGGQYIAGFDFLYTGNTKHEINGFKLVTSSTAVPSTSDVALSGSVTMSTDGKYAGSGTVGLGFLAFNQPSTGIVLGVGTATADISWNNPNGSSGITGSFKASFTPPTGYQISQAAFLMSYIYLNFKQYHDLGMIAAGQTGTLSIDNTNNQVTGNLIMNLFSNEGIEHCTIQNDSSMNASVLVVFEPVPVS